MLTRDRAIQLLRQNREYLSAEFGVSRIGLFGSVARDESTEFSRPIGFRFVDLADYLEGLLGHKVDLLTSAGLQAIISPRVFQSISEGVVYV